MLKPFQKLYPCFTMNLINTNHTIVHHRNNAFGAHETRIQMKLKKPMRLVDLANLPGVTDSNFMLSWVQLDKLFLSIHNGDLIIAWDPKGFTVGPFSDGKITLRPCV